MAIVNPLRPSPFLYVIIFLIFLHATFSNLDSDALLQLKKSFTNAQALNSWQSGLEPCAIRKQWAGLVCEDGLVTGLRLAKMGLSGKIDVNALLQIPNLRSFTINNNMFAGPIPNFNRMGAIRGIYLSNNQFSGEIPSDFFEEMASLRKLWLDNNNFTGDIPLSLAQIHHLNSLHLENNQFSGAIPEFKQSTLVSLNLSNNNLIGVIPPSLSKFNASSFVGNVDLCGEKIGKPCNQTEEPSASPPTLSPPITESDTESNAFAYALIVFSVVVLIIMGVAIIVLSRKQKNLGGFEKENLDESIGSVGWRRASSVNKKDIMDHFGSTQKSLSSSRRGGKGIGDLMVVNDEKGLFGMTDLMKAGAEVLGNGSLGSSYKAILPNGFTVVVKRIKEMNKIRKDGFEAEITRMAGLKHPNILTPLAYHYRKEEKLLVYEYIPKGSLLYVLHGDQGAHHAELNWPTRLKIIKGIARGLNYLHTQYACSELPHGDLKSSNVLISSNYEPLLADYGLSSLISINQVRQSLFAAYRSPEVLQRHQVSPKCDVYCLGIIILEVITGKFPSQYLNHGNGGTDVVEWVKSAIPEGREADLIDPEVVTAKNGLGEMRRLLQIGNACAESSPERRLDIREAIKKIEEIQVEGTIEEKTFNLAPSLGDGCANAPELQSLGPSNVQNGSNQLSESRQESYGSQIS